MEFWKDAQQIKLSLSVNGTPLSLYCTPASRLLDVLRGPLGLTGTKEGCGVGECGACTVLVNGKAVCACLTPAIQAEGQEVWTIEGLGSEEAPHPIQQSFSKNHAIGCGFCTPGFVMSAKALLNENPQPTREDILEATEGNLCRCTGYDSIVAAIEDVGKSGTE